MFFEFIVESGMNFANILKVGSYTQISNYCGQAMDQAVDPSNGRKGRYLEET